MNRRVSISIERAAAPEPQARESQPPAAKPNPQPAPPPTKPEPPAIKTTPAPKIDQNLEIERPILPVGPIEPGPATWPLFNQPKLSGILAQPTTPGGGLIVDTVVRPDFQAFTSGVNVKHQGFVDFTKPAPPAFNPVAGIGLGVSASSLSLPHMKEGVTAPKTESNGFWRDTSESATPRDVPRLRVVK